MDRFGYMSPEDAQPVAVEFIDARLPDYHAAFVHPPVRYDAVSGRYVPKEQFAREQSLREQSLREQPPREQPPREQSPREPSNPPRQTVMPPEVDIPQDDIPPRPAWTTTDAMRFWAAIFPSARAQFLETPEPKGRAGTPYDVRDKHDWDAVYETLGAAREKYRQDGGNVGWLRRVRRRVADNVSPGVEAVKIANKVVPNNPYSTPVLGAVEVLLDAVQTAATVRQQALGAFDGLVAIFSDVELFLSTFPKDVNIRSASVDLTAATLEAVERAIGFFISNDFKRAGKAVLSGVDYEKKLVESLDAINAKSKCLMEEATKSHIHNFHLYSKETKKLHQEVVQIVGKGVNSIHDLLQEHLRAKDRELEAARQENMYLRVQNGILRSTSPSPSSPPPPPQRAASWFSQDVLRRMLDCASLAPSDAASVSDLKLRLPDRQRARAEQLVQTDLFRAWIVSPGSAKLLVHWDSASVVAGVSPLSALCLGMAAALQHNERFLAAVWFCGRHLQVDDDDEEQAEKHVGGRAMLASLIDQLLSQHAFDTRPLHHAVNLASLHAASAPVLTTLLACLVRQLPPTTTLFVLVDGVAGFERPEHEDEALPALLGLLALVADAGVSAAVKLLFASAPATDVVRGAFEEEQLVLDVGVLPGLSRPMSDERFGRELMYVED